MKKLLTIFVFLAVAWNAPAQEEPLIEPLEFEFTIPMPGADPEALYWACYDWYKEYFGETDVVIYNKILYPDTWRQLMYLSYYTHRYDFFFHYHIEFPDNKVVISMRDFDHSGAIGPLSLKNGRLDKKPFFNRSAYRRAVRDLDRLPEMFNEMCTSLSEYLGPVWQYRPQ